MNWTTVTFKDGRKRHDAKTSTRVMAVYDWKYRVQWFVDTLPDKWGKVATVKGECASVAEGKATCEALTKGV